MPNFWTTLQPIRTDTFNRATDPKNEPIPYHNLPGSGAGDAIGDTVAKFYPVMDGKADGPGGDREIYRLTAANPFPDATDPSGSKVDGLSLRPDNLRPEDFRSWHSAHQLQYLHQREPSSRAALIGKNTAAGIEGAITAVMSADGKEVFILEDLKKTDIARLSLADQQLIANHESFRVGHGDDKPAIAAILGLLPLQGEKIGDASASSVGDAKAALIALVNQASTGLGNLKDVRLSDGTTRNDVSFFKDQLKNLETRINNSAVFSRSEIEKVISEVTTRHKRALAFNITTSASAYPTGSGSPTTQYQNVVSTDNNAGINRGYDTFLKNERRLLELDNSRLSVASTGVTANRKLDVPNLVYFIQLQYNLTAETKVTIETEEISQQNALLQIYGQMQKIVNNVAKAFTGDDDEKTDRNILGRDKDTAKDDKDDDSDGIDKDDSVTRLSGSFTDQEIRVISMFEDLLSRTNASSSNDIFKHPMETLRSIDRPTQDFFDQSGTPAKLNWYVKTTWDIFNTQLSDTVTLINQENQIKMNDINSMNKQKDRHFDLANGALSKMFDTIQSIARATGG